MATAFKAARLERTHGPILLMGGRGHEHERWRHPASLEKKQQQQQKQQRDCLERIQITQDPGSLNCEPIRLGGYIDAAAVCNLPQLPGSPRAITRMLRRGIPASQFAIEVRRTALGILVRMRLLPAARVFRTTRRRRVGSLRAHWGPSTVVV